MDEWIFLGCDVCRCKSCLFSKYCRCFAKKDWKYYVGVANCDSDWWYVIPMWNTRNPILKNKFTRKSSFNREPTTDRDTNQKAKKHVMPHQRYSRLKNRKRAHFPRRRFGSSICCSWSRMQISVFQFLLNFCLNIIMIAIVQRMHVCMDGW